jgi:hypothetical protein
MRQLAATPFLNWRSNSASAMRRSGLSCGKVTQLDRSKATNDEDEDADDAAGGSAEARVSNNWTAC